MRGFHRPTMAIAERRLETQAGFIHQPLAALSDRPAMAGAASESLWRAHQAAMANQQSQLRSITPRIDASSHDPFALRAAILLLALVGVVVAGQTAPDRLRAAFALPERNFGPAATVTAWLTPPAYTGQAPVLIDPGTKSIAMLPGSELAVVAAGMDSAPAGRMIGHKLEFDALGDQSFRAVIRPAATGRLVIGPWWHHLADWQIDVQQAAAPKVTFTTPPRPAADGVHTHLAYQAQDQYGLASLSLRINPVASATAPALHIALPPHASKGGRASLASPDLTASPYAGLAVRLVLQARNLAGLSAQSAPATMILPMPHLTNATARAIAALRRDLALDPSAAQLVANMLAGLAAAPPAPITDSADIQIAFFARALYAHAPEAGHPLARMWQLVQLAEQGEAYASAQNLAQAPKALQQGLADKNLTSAQLAQLLSNYQTALAAHNNALAQQSGQTPQAGTQAGTQAALAPFDPAQINRLAQQIARDMQAGRTEKAQAEMQQLQAMMQALQNARPMSAADAARAAAAQQAASALDQLTQQQAQLLDKTGQAQGQTNGLTDQQNQLSQALQALREQAAQAGLPGLPGLAQGQRAMGEAGQHLQTGDQSGAMAAQRAAIQSLQQAARALAQDRAGQGYSMGPPGSGQDQDIPGGPLGQANQDNVKLNSQGPADKARTIEQDLIRRDSAPALPPPTRSYLRRLLGN
ncbi:MAG: hypothetical protein B7X01_00240 [Acidiphilium sp. 21-62-4]|nr:MAG: hypothetical protein B7X01_00240 [Acidiphilium sp. 21-62-4]